MKIEVGDWVKYNAGERDIICQVERITECYVHFAGDCCVYKGGVLAVVDVKDRAPKIETTDEALAWVKSKKLEVRQYKDGHVVVCDPCLLDRAVAGLSVLQTVRSYAELNP